MPPLAETLSKSGRGGQSSWIEIDLGRLLSNLRLIKQIVAERGGAQNVMAVVKANAYGHGLIDTARALEKEVSYLGVSSLYEILELKEHGIKAPLFLFGRLFGQELVTAVKSGITMSVSSFDEAAEISEISESLITQTPVHIKVDTGMGRLGIPQKTAVSEIRKIAELPGLSLEGIYTHFPAAERADGFAEKQLQHFIEIINELESKNIRFRFKHASNSAGNLRIETPAFRQLNLMRPGLILYGISPDTSLRTAGFKPVLSLKTRIILVKKIEGGDSVGYGRAFVSPRAATIATLPVGYSHGYPWHLSGKAFVLYKGKRCPIAGRVSMDYICADLGEMNAQAGDEVTLLGEDGGESITAEEMAKWAGTIPYEIVTRLSHRLPRIYHHV